jgi:hypothetical protein
MKAIIKITNGYFTKDWTLVVTNKNGIDKSFYLGQDVKFCNRILGIRPADVIQEIGSAEIEEPKINKKLAKFIIKQLGLTSKLVNDLNKWELCAQ